MKACTQCGKCCIQYGGGGLTASREEIWNWEVFRPDIAAHVIDGEIWMDPISGERLDRCPWLEEVVEEGGSGTVRYGCLIYEDRPEECRHYPVAIAEMVRDGCEMIEVRDLDAPAAAQIALDAMMADSRPPLA